MLKKFIAWFFRPVQEKQSYTPPRQEYRYQPELPLK